MSITAIVAVPTGMTFGKVTPVCPAIVVILVSLLGPSPFGFLAFFIATGTSATDSVNLFVEDSNGGCHCSVFGGCLRWRSWLIGALVRKFIHLGAERLD